jgi:hypothetical protein
MAVQYIGKEKMDVSIFVKEPKSIEALDYYGHYVQNTMCQPEWDITPEMIAQIQLVLLAYKKRIGNSHDAPCANSRSPMADVSHRAAIPLSRRARSGR